MPGCFKACMPYILASVVHHFSWLEDNLPADHPLRHSSVWTSGTLRSLKPDVLLGNGRCPETGMMATGLPPHIMHAIQVSEVRSTVEKRTAAILECLHGLPEAVRADVLSHIQVDGAREVTYNEIVTLLNNLRSQLTADLSTGTEHGGPSGGAVSDSDHQRDTSWWQLFYYNRRWSYVPEGFEFPGRLPLKEIWDLYFLGNKEAHIRPYRLLAKHLSRKSQKVFSEAKKLIEYVALYGQVDVNNVHTVSDLYEMTHAQLNDVYNRAYSCVCSRFDDGANMRADLSYRTLYFKVLLLVKEDKHVRRMLENPDSSISDCDSDNDCASNSETE